MAYGCVGLWIFFSGVCQCPNRFLDSATTTGLAAHMWLTSPRYGPPATAHPPHPTHHHWLPLITGSDYVQ